METFNSKPDVALAKKTALASLGRDSKKDITSGACIPAGAVCTGAIVAKSDFVLCGIIEAGTIFAARKVKAMWRFSEGKEVKRGSIVCTISGNCRAALACERTALNYLSLLSGIATKCAKASRKYGKWKIAATRKTLPNLSDSEKRAVLKGRCLTHRMSLADGILVKDNHLAAIMENGKMSKEKAIVAAVSAFKQGEFVEVEVSSAPEAAAAAKAGAKAILVDNVTPQQLAKIAKAARKINRKIIIEASGGITLANAGKYLKAGADFVSTSELTMRIEPANLSLEIQ